MNAAHAFAAPLPEALTMKGVGFVNLRHFVERLGSHVEWRDVLDALPEADREIVSSAVAVGWYDVLLFGRTLRAVDQVCGRGDLSLMEEIGAYECEQDFQRVLHVFLRVLSPAMLLKAQARLWRHPEPTAHAKRGSRAGLRRSIWPRMSGLWHRRRWCAHEPQPSSTNALG